jgi:hypothetical protein
MKKLLVVFAAFMISGLGAAVAQEAAAPAAGNEPAKMEEAKKEVKAEKKHAKKHVKKAEKKMEEKKVEEAPPAPPAK